jgi:hypothetical protein
VTYFGGVSSDTTHVDLPQNGLNSHALPGSTVAQRVDAKHIPGKSENRRKNKSFNLKIDYLFIVFAKCTRKSIQNTYVKLVLRNCQYFNFTFIDLHIQASPLIATRQDKSFKSIFYFTDLENVGGSTKYEKKKFL